MLVDEKKLLKNGHTCVCGHRCGVSFIAHTQESIVLFFVFFNSLPTYEKCCSVATFLTHPTDLLNKGIRVTFEEVCFTATLCPVFLLPNPTQSTPMSQRESASRESSSSSVVEFQARKKKKFLVASSASYRSNAETETKIKSFVPFNLL